MKKIVMWHKGVENLVSKRNISDAIDTVSSRGHFNVTKKDLVLFTRRSPNATGWKNAIERTLPRKAEDIIAGINTVGSYPLSKAELRKFATFA